jgi:hypothetical protein
LFNRRIGAEILFLDDKIRTTKEYARQLKNMGVKLDRQPAVHKSVIMSFDYNKRRVICERRKRSLLSV